MILSVSVRAPSVQVRAPHSGRARATRLGLRQLAAAFQTGRRED